MVEKNTGMYNENVITIYLYLFANFDDVNQTVIINQQISIVKWYVIYSYNIIYTLKKWKI